MVVDMQNDFLPGGALGVEGGDAVLPVVNHWIRTFQDLGLPLLFSRDWHPAEHCSFKQQGGPWPPHCIEHTPGAAFHPDLCLPADARIVGKATQPNREAYSALDETGAVEWLGERGVRRLWIGGLALDYCVRATALDALKADLDVVVLTEATRAVNLQPDDGRKALQEIADAGATLLPGRSLPKVPSLLMTDLYELTMVQAYHAAGMDDPATRDEHRATFELFFRELPAGRRFAMAAGLNDVLTFLEHARLSDDDLDYLRGQGQFNDAFLERLRDFRFSGDVDAVPEGTIVFPNEPLVQVTAPIAEAQLVETLVLNHVHFQTVVASKAAHVVLAAGDRTVVDFGSRRAHDVDAALRSARAAYLAGAAGTSNVMAGKNDGIPIFGTMAHSYVQAWNDELAAWEHFVRLYPETTLLVDTFDTLEGVRHVIELSRRLGDEFRVRAVRLDSGDLAELAHRTRKLLDEAGLPQVKIFASGGLDERKIALLMADGAPIDGFGVGTKMVVSEDAPTLDFAYKLVEYAGRPRTKLSTDKVIYPGRKQVFRTMADGVLRGDLLAPHDAQAPGRPLLEPVMRGGRRLPVGCRTLQQSRRHAAAELAALPERLRSLDAEPAAYPVEVSDELTDTLERLRQELRA